MIAAGPAVAGGYLSHCMPHSTFALASPSPTGGAAVSPRPAAMLAASALALGASAAGATENLIEGGADADILIGTPGPDLIFGREGDDTIDGGEGDDTIDPGPGEDSVTAGAGNDVVEARDGERDTIACLPDAEVVIGADPIDRLRTCNDRDVTVGPGTLRRRTTGPCARAPRCTWSTTSRRSPRCSPMARAASPGSDPSARRRASTPWATHSPSTAGSARSATPS